MAARSLTYPFQPAFRPEFIALLRSTAEPAPWEGLSAIDWARTFDAGLANVLAAAGYAELHARLTRQQLAAFCARDDVPIALRVAAVMAWGRANYRSTRNNKLLWAFHPQNRRTDRATSRNDPSPGIRRFPASRFQSHPAGHARFVLHQVDVLYAVSRGSHSGSMAGQERSCAERGKLACEGRRSAGIHAVTRPFHPVKSWGNRHSRTHVRA